MLIADDGVNWIKKYLFIFICSFDKLFQIYVVKNCLVTARIEARTGAGRVWKISLTQGHFVIRSPNGKVERFNDFFYLERNYDKIVIPRSAELTKQFGLQHLLCSTRRLLVSVYVSVSSDIGFGANF